MAGTRWIGTGSPRPHGGLRVIGDAARATAHAAVSAAASAAAYPPHMWLVDEKRISTVTLELETVTVPDAGLASKPAMGETLNA